MESTSVPVNRCKDQEALYLLKQNGYIELIMTSELRKRIKEPDGSTYM